MYKSNWTDSINAQLSKGETKPVSSGMFLDCPPKYTKQHGKVAMHIKYKRYSVWIVKILKFSIIRSKIFLYIFSLLKLSELILSYARWCYCVFLSMVCVCVRVYYIVYGISISLITLKREKEKCSFWTWEMKVLVTIVIKKIIFVCEIEWDEYRYNLISKRHYIFRLK